MFRTLLELSTQHTPDPNDSDWGTVYYSETEYGWLVTVLSPTPDDYDVPDWLSPIWEFARNNQCGFIYFHADAEEMNIFRKYDW
jgi:hypothetical protein